MTLLLQKDGQPYVETVGTENIKIRLAEVGSSRVDEREVTITVIIQHQRVDS